jgi:hypothetical protein
MAPPLERGAPARAPGGPTATFLGSWARAPTWRWCAAAGLRLEHFQVIVLRRLRSRNIQKSVTYNSRGCIDYEVNIEARKLKVLRGL